MHTSNHCTCLLITYTNTSNGSNSRSKASAAAGLIFGGLPSKGFRKMRMILRMLSLFSLIYIKTRLPYVERSFGGLEILERVVGDCAGGMGAGGTGGAGSGLQID